MTTVTRSLKTLTHGISVGVTGAILMILLLVAVGCATPNNAINTRVVSSLTHLEVMDPGATTERKTVMIAGDLEVRVHRNGKNFCYWWELEPGDDVVVEYRDLYKTRAIVEFTVGSHGVFKAHQQVEAAGSRVTLTFYPRDSDEGIISAKIWKYVPMTYILDHRHRIDSYVEGGTR